MLKLRVVGGNKKAGTQPAAENNHTAQAPAGFHLEMGTDLGKILDAYDVSAYGLSAEEAAERLSQNGPNSFVHEKTLRWWTRLLHAFNNAFILLLLTLALVAALTGDVQAATIIATMVLISAILRFTQEFRSSRAAEKLHDLVQTTATQPVTV